MIAANLLDPHRAQMLLLAEQHDHRHRRFQCPVELLAGIDLDDVAADHPHRLVIGETLGARDDHPVDHAVGKRQAQHLQRVVAGDAGGGAERHRCGAAAGDDAPFGPGQFGEAPARRRHQFVEIDEPARRLGHRLAHLRQHQAAAMHRADAAAIDERPHAEGEIGIGIGAHRFSAADRVRLYQRSDAGVPRPERLAPGFPPQPIAVAVNRGRLTAMAVKSTESGKTARRRQSAEGRLRAGRAKRCRGCARSSTRLAVDQRSDEASEQWARKRGARASELAKELREQGERAVGRRLGDRSSRTR